MEQFLDIAEKHKIGVMFVLFDSVWDPYPKAGQQRAPNPHRHNSGWVQSPGQDILQDPAKQDELKAYVQDVIGHFRNDQRIQVWDLFNEPDNLVPQYRDVLLPGKVEFALQLLQKDLRLGARDESDTTAHLGRLDRQLGRSSETLADRALPA